MERKTEMVTFMYQDSRGNKCLSGQLPHEVMITDKYVIIILFSSGGQLLIA